MAGSYDQDTRELPRRRRVRLKLMPRPIDKAFLDELSAELGAVAGITDCERLWLFARVAGAIRQCQVGMIGPIAMHLVVGTTLAPFEERMPAADLLRLRTILHRAFSQL